MYKYILGRLLLLIPTLLGVTFLVFSILNVLPGNPGRLILGTEAPQSSVDMLNASFGLDKPFLVRFVNYVGDVITKFEFGNSYRSQNPVVKEITKALPITFALALSSVITAIILGVPFGILAAVRRSTLTDTSITVWAMFLASIPPFWLAIMLMSLFAIKIKLFPIFGISGVESYVLPIISIGLPGSTGFIRLTRVTMLETVNQEYIKTARAKGAPEYSVIWKHAFKNAVLPIINGAGLAFSALLGGSIITETVFSMPGLGLLTLQAIRSKDVPIVMASTLFLSTIFCLIVLLIDIVYALIDPRIKAKFSS